LLISFLWLMTMLFDKVTLGDIQKIINNINTGKVDIKTIWSGVPPRLM